MYRRIIAPSVLAASLLLVIPASAADFTPGAPGIGDPYYPASGNGGYDVSHYDLKLRYQPATDLLEGTATLARHHPAGPLPLRPGLRSRGQRGAGRTAPRRPSPQSGSHELEITPATPLPKGTLHHRRGEVRGQALRVEGRRLDGLAAHPGRRGGGPGAGFGGVVVPVQRPPAGQGHLRRVGQGAGRHPGHQQRRSAVARVRSWAGPRTTGAPTSRRPPTWRRSPSGKFDITTDKTASGLPGPQRLQQGPRRQRRRRARQRRAHRATSPSG